jgi:hypothetical protein
MHIDDAAVFPFKAHHSMQELSKRKRRRRRWWK